ncbi:MAG: hypothetical protein OJF50_002508 [Nitrospira sp.]|jgi:hypothetical protein|nr:hypothetical protein [Nitrospira sp.]
MRNKTVDRHSPDTDSMTIWMPKRLKQRIRQEAKEANLPHWGMSAHAVYILSEAFDMWDKPYKPHSGVSPKKPTQEAPRKA